MVDIARVHRRRMVTAAFKLDRQFNGLIDVGDDGDQAGSRTSPRREGRRAWKRPSTDEIASSPYFPLRVA